MVVDFGKRAKITFCEENTLNHRARLMTEYAFCRPMEFRLYSEYEKGIPLYIYNKNTVLDSLIYSTLSSIAEMHRCVAIFLFEFKPDADKKYSLALKDQQIRCFDGVLTGIFRENTITKKFETNWFVAELNNENKTNILVALNRDYTEDEYLDEEVFR